MKPEGDKGSLRVMGPCSVLGLLCNPKTAAMHIILPRPKQYMASYSDAEESAPCPIKNSQSHTTRVPVSNLAKSKRTITLPILWLCTLLAMSTIINASLPSLTISNSISNGHGMDVLMGYPSDNAVVTATCGTVGDTCQIWKVDGTSALASGTTTATLPINNLAAGYTGIYANDISASLTSNTQWVRRISVSHIATVTLTNKQNTAVSPDTSLMITFNSPDFQPWESDSLNNTAIAFQNGTVAYSWLEGNVYNEQSAANTLYQSSNVAIWFKSPATNAFLPADTGTATTNTVIMGFDAPSNNLLDGNFIGEAPQLSCNNPSNTVSGCAAGQYGKYDDGSLVFKTLYQNFAGTLTPSGWLKGGGDSAEIVQDNGLKVGVSGGSAVEYLFSQTNYGLNANQILDTYAESMETSGSDLESFFGYANYTSGNAAGVSWLLTGSSGILPIDSAGGGYTTGTLSPSTGAYHVLTVYWPSTSSSTFSYDYGSSKDTITTNIDPAAIGAGIFLAEPISYQEFMQWIRIRAYPPNGIMPSEIFSPAYASSFTPTLTSSPTLPASIDVGQSIAFTATVSGGTTPYTYNYIVSNSATGAVVFSQQYSSVNLGTNTFTWTPASSYTGPLEVNVVVTDAHPTTVGSAYISTLTVNPALSAGAITPASPTIDSGQSVTLTSHPSGGTTGSGSTSYVPITLTNSQSGATSGNFQQMLTINSLKYESYINANWMNVEFTDGPASGNVLNAWVESNPSNTATNTIVWVLLDNSIAANSNEIIYMDFMASNVMSSSGPTGEAPQLSPSYGQYDDGANVFAFYDNFAGTTLNPEWHSAIKSSGGSIAVNNGITFSASASTDYAMIATASLFSYPMITEMLFDPGSTASSGITPTIGESTTYGLNSYDNLYNGYSYDWVVGTASSGVVYANSGSGALTIASSLTDATSNSIVGFSWSATGTQDVYDGYSDIASESDPSIAISNYYPYIGLTSNGGGSAVVRWARVRKYPPSGIMPSSTYGTVGSSATYQYQWYTLAGSTAPSCTSANAISGATSSTYVASPATTNTYAYQVTDSATTPVSVCSSGDTVTVNALPTISLATNPTAPASVTAGGTITFNALVTGGTGPFTYNFYIYNSVTDATINSFTTSSNSFVFTTNANLIGSTLNANVFVTDAAGAIANSVLTGIFNIISPYSPPSVPTITSPTNVIVDVGQYETFNTYVTGGIQPYTYNFYVTNSVAPTSYNEIAVGANYVTFQVVQPYVANSPIEVNAVVQDAHPTTVNSVYSSTFTVSAALSSVTISVSNTLLDADQYVTITPTITGGSSPYVANFVISNQITGKAINTITVTSASPTATFYLPSWIIGNTIQANVVITDSATTNEILASGYNALGFNSVLQAGAITPASPMIDAGQNVILSSDPLGGTLDGSGFTLLHSFVGSPSDGYIPWGQLIQSGELLYGMTVYGGSSDNGIIFSYNTVSSVETVLHSFFGGSADGSQTEGSLIQSGNMLYGMTYSGGSSNNGVIFSYNTISGAETVLHSFSGGSSDGAHPLGSLLQIGNLLYGMTDNGGPSNNGVIFSYNMLSSAETVLHSFSGGSSDGAHPQVGSLIQSGNLLYGMTNAGGSSNKGVIFSYNTVSSALTVLHSFAGGTNDGEYPLGSSFIQSGSLLYSMTNDGGASNKGVIFSYNTISSTFIVLHSFTGTSYDGYNPYGSLIQSGNTLYGMTSSGGSSDDGVIFSLNIGYSYQWYAIAGTTAPACTPTNAISGATSSTYAASPLATNSYAYEVTDAATTPESACSSGDTVTVNALPSISMVTTPAAPSNVVAGNTITFNALVTGGTGPFTYTFYIYNSVTDATINSFTTSSNSFVFTANTNLIGNTLDANVFVTDNTAATANSALTGTFNVISAYTPPSTPTLTSSPTLPASIDFGQSVTFSSSWTGGTASYTANYLVVNTVTGTIVANMLHAGISGTSDSWTWTPTSAYAGNTLKVNVIVTDSHPTTVNSVYISTLTVNPALSTPTLTPSSPTIDNGQSVTFTASWSGGTPTYGASLYSSATSTCNQQSTLV